MSADLLKRKAASFVLWAPGQSSPRLVIGTFKYGAPPSLEAQRSFALNAVSGQSGLWLIAASSCGLTENTVYHYWFDVDDTSPGSAGGTRVLVTDPTAVTVDWRLTQEGGDQPASVVKFAGGQLVQCDADGTLLAAPQNLDPRGLATNNFTIIYELPPAWTRQPRGGGSERAVGTFRDVIGMIDKAAQAPNFVELEAAEEGHAHIAELGINAVELLPPADSYYEREWGYGTSHMYAPDYELGHPDFNSWSTANSDLRRLADACHSLNIRLIDDVVMGFVRTGSYERIAFDDFHIAWQGKPPDDPDALSSRGGPRFQFGTLWRYVRQITTYDPVSGLQATFAPARNLHYVAQERWMNDFNVDGYRIDSVETVANWDFLGTFTSNARDRFRARCAGHGMSQADADARFLVVGEELNEPIDILTQGRITALWHDSFHDYVRNAVLGQSANNENFEWTVRKMVDCRLFGYSDMAQAVIYLGTHDVEGLHRERIATMFRYQFPNDNDNDNGEIGRRVKLAFACLLTAVGIPMILAGDEFADENDLFNIKGNVSNQSGKQIDPVDFGRLEGDDNAWRRDVLTMVKRLIALRKTHAALGLNDTKILHTDIMESRRIVVWQRGGDDNPVVVVANFSDFATDHPGNGISEYRVPNWPRPGDFTWREVSQQRTVPQAWIGREPLFPWEAKVYAHV